MRVSALYAGQHRLGSSVIYVEDDINGESRHPCVGNVTYDHHHATYGQKRHVWTGRRLRGKPILGSARVPPVLSRGWAIVSITGIAMAQQHRFAATDTNL
ncbi:MAG: hypothetical protein JO230_28190 [Xanthobacteraceae bacterium]|nr:hypothetical protein [Xanthobacteraceae bacterium]